MAASMELITLMGLIHLICFFSLVSSQNVPKFKEFYFDQYVDHFNFLSFGEQTYKQRVLVQDKWWKVNKTGPIFFYTGNEGPITTFWDNTGFIFDIAPEFGALVLFAEHRFYGKSLPFGNDSFDKKYVGLLTVEQALADYAVLLTYFRESVYFTNSPVIAFGGSYGGMLTAYLRYKYPGIVAGGIASSAPIFLLDPNFDKSFFWKTVTKDFNDVTPQCVTQTRTAFMKMNSSAVAGDFHTLSKKFNLCKDLTNLADYRHLLLWIRNAFGFLAMMDYPYPTDFMGDLPAYPVKEACKYLLSEADAVLGLAKATGLFYNGTSGSLKCFNIFDEYVECADPTGCGTGSDGMAWDYQACTEIRLPTGTDGVHDMFPVLPFTDEMRQDYCSRKWGVWPRVDWGKTELINLDLIGASNIVFANGDLDPWIGGGVNKSSNPSITPVLVKGGAHHLDLRGSNPMDPESVKEARLTEKKQITKWLSEWKP